MKRLDPLEQFEDMRTISPAVAKYVNDETFKVVHYKDGQYTIQDVLNDCYLLLIEELEDIGVTFLVSYDDILVDNFTAKHIYYLREAFSENFLTEWLLNHPMDIDKLDMFVESDEGDPLITYLTYTSNAYPHHTPWKYLTYILDRIKSTHVFNAYIRDFIERVRQIPTETFSNTEVIREYIQRVSKIRQRVVDGANYVWEHHGFMRAKIDQSKLSRLLDDYDLDKLQADDINIFAHVDRDEVNPGLLDLKTKSMDEHHRRSPHHIEYWLNREDLPSLEDELMLILHHYSELDSTEQSFLEESTGMLDKYPTLFKRQEHHLDRVIEIVRELYLSDEHVD